MSAYIDKSLNRCKKEQVTFAITGRSATGKYTFINTIRNIKPGDDGFAMAGSGDTIINAKYDDKKKDMVLPEIRRKVEITLNANPELNTKRIFLISSRKPYSR